MQLEKIGSQRAPSITNHLDENGKDILPPFGILALKLIKKSHILISQRPLRKIATSYNTDELNISQWSRKGTLRFINNEVVKCAIQLGNKIIGELCTRAF